MEAFSLDRVWLPILNLEPESSRNQHELGIDMSFSYELPELVVEFVEVMTSHMHTRSKVTLRVNGEVWMITLVGKEGCNASSALGVCVVSKLR